MSGLDCLIRAISDTDYLTCAKSGLDCLVSDFDCLTCAISGLECLTWVMTDLPG